MRFNLYLKKNNEECFVGTRVLVDLIIQFLDPLLLPPYQIEKEDSTATNYYCSLREEFFQKRMRERAKRKISDL